MATASVGGHQLGASAACCFMPRTSLLDMHVHSIVDTAQEPGGSRAIALTVTILLHLDNRRSFGFGVSARRRPARRTRWPSAGPRVRSSYPGVATHSLPISDPKVPSFSYGPRGHVTRGRTTSDHHVSRPSALIPPHSELAPVQTSSGPGRLRTRAKLLRTTSGETLVKVNDAGAGRRRPQRKLAGAEGISDRPNGLAPAQPHEFEQCRLAMRGCWPLEGLPFRHVSSPPS